MSKPFLSFAVPFSSSHAHLCGIRVHWHRNIAGYCFVSKMKEEDKSKLTQFIKGTLEAHFPGCIAHKPPFSHVLGELFSDISQEATLCLIDPVHQLCFSLMDGDHLKATLHTHATDIKTLTQEIKIIDTKLKAIFHYASSPMLGYLTAQPEFYGLGISLAAFLFSPHLPQVRQLPSNLELTPYCNHPSFFVLKTQNTIHTDLVSLLGLFTQALFELEALGKKEQRLALETRKNQITDQVAKSLALLKGAYQLNYQDTLDHLLSLKMGYHLGLLVGLEKDLFLDLAQQAQRAHLAQHLGLSETQDDWLHERAAWMQEKLQMIHFKQDGHPLSSG